MVTHYNTHPNNLNRAYKHTACSRLTKSEATTNKKKVTCKQCRKALKKR